MPTTLIQRLDLANAGLKFGKEVIERRAEMAAQCECLAAWIDGRECICGDRTANVPLSTANLKKAHEIVREIEACEKRLELVSKIASDNAVCLVELGGQKVHYSNGGGFYYEDSAGHMYGPPKVTLPKSVLVAALKDERLRLMVKLRETGIVSVDQSNIRIIPK